MWQGVLVFGFGREENICFFSSCKKKKKAVVWWGAGLHYVDMMISRMLLRLDSSDTKSINNRFI